MNLLWFCQAAELLAGLESHTVVKVASNAEGRHFLAVTSDGRVFSWGTGDGGQLGLGDFRSALCFLYSWIAGFVFFIDVFKY